MIESVREGNGQGPDVRFDDIKESTLYEIISPDFNKGRIVMKPKAMNCLIEVYNPEKSHPLSGWSRPEQTNLAFRLYEGSVTLSNQEE